MRYEIPFLLVCSVTYLLTYCIAMLGLVTTKRPSHNFRTPRDDSYFIMVS
jgi:hypothetical protein